MYVCMCIYIYIYTHNASFRATGPNAFNELLGPTIPKSQQIVFSETRLLAATRLATTLSQPRPAAAAALRNERPWQSML